MFAGEEAHDPCSCAQLAEWELKCVNESETANWILANTRKCPACNARIEKNQGCNHMTCRLCKHDFCWICMGTLSASRKLLWLLSVGFPSSSAALLALLNARCGRWQGFVATSDRDILIAARWMLTVICAHDSVVQGAGRTTGSRQAGSTSATVSCPQKSRPSSAPSTRPRRTSTGTSLLVQFFA
jgi:hypothetical protein